MSQPAAAELPARLQVTAVRGYQAQAERVGELLAAAAGLDGPPRSGRWTPPSPPRASAPRRTATRSASISTPAMPARAALQAVLLQLLDTLEANVAGTIRDIDTEFLHDLRVAVRRTRSALKLAGDVLPASLPARFRPEFKWLGDLTTPTRDLDVYLLGYDEMAAALVSAAPAELEPFHAHLARRRVIEQRALARGLRSARFSRLACDWRGALTGLTVPSRRRARPRTWPPGGCAGRTGGCSARAGRSARTPPPDDLHDLRKRCKELRYLLEIFASVFDPQAYQRALKDLKGLQDCLGEFQDRQVQQQELREFADQMIASRAQSPAPCPPPPCWPWANWPGGSAAPSGGPATEFAEPVRRIRQPGQRPQVPGPDRECRPGPGRRCGPMKILATYNIKGGVGKTSTAVNLSYLAAQDGLRVLLWDLDPQAAASFLFRIRPRVKGGGKALIKGSREIDDSIKGTDFADLDLLPADFTYRNLDLVLGATKKPTRRIARLLAPLSDQYDVIFLDCPPGISLLSESVLQAADSLLVPLIPTVLSLRTLDQLTDFLASFDGQRPGGARVLLHDRPAQAAAPGDRRAAAGRARRRGRGHHPRADPDRADVRGTRPGGGVRAAQPGRPVLPGLVGGSAGPRSLTAGAGPDAAPGPRRAPRARSRPRAGSGPGTSPLEITESYHRGVCRRMQARARSRGACY